MIHWSSIADFAEMGGYALYVWGSFAMCAAALVWEAVLLAQQRRRALEELHEDARAAGAEELAR
jgi:heme exporter protein D